MPANGRSPATTPGERLTRGPSLAGSGNGACPGAGPAPAATSVATPVVPGIRQGAENGLFPENHDAQGDCQKFRVRGQFYERESALG